MPKQIPYPLRGRERKPFEKLSDRDIARLLGRPVAPKTQKLLTCGLPPETFDLLMEPRAAKVLVTRLG